jgi:ATP-dependent Clp protease ATP-binding subunit ClpB
VVFRPLGIDEIKKIVSLELFQLASRMAKQQSITLSFDKDVVKFLSDKSFDPAQGARLVRRNIQEWIEDPLAEKIITGEVREMNEVKVTLENDKIIIKQVEFVKV